MRTCEFHGYASDFEEAGRVAKATLRNVQICPTPREAAVGMDSVDSSESATGGPECFDDATVETLMQKLFPKLVALVAAEVAGEAEDGKEEEQAAMFDSEVSSDPFAEANSFYKAEKARWAASNQRNSERRSLSGVYQPVNASAKAAAKRAS